MNLQHIHSLLSQANLPTKLENGSLLSILSVNGHEAILCINTQVDGAVLNFEVVGLLPSEIVRNSNHIGAFVSFVLAHNWKTPAGSCELDRDGELRVVMEIPMADLQMSMEQLHLTLKLLKMHCHAMLTQGVEVLKTGELQQKQDATPVEQAQEQVAMGHQIYLQFVEMAKTPAGREQLAAVASAQSGLPTNIRQMAQAVLEQAGPAEL